MRGISNLRYIFKKIYAYPGKDMNNRHKVACGCEICTYESSIKSEFNTFISRNILKPISVPEISHLRR